MKRPTYQRVGRPERRRYWHNGVIVDVELWRAGKVAVTMPPTLPHGTIDVDYCATHGRPIYPDLACELCQERALARPTGVAAPSSAAA